MSDMADSHNLSSDNQDGYTLWPDEAMAAAYLAGWQNCYQEHVSASAEPRAGWGIADIADDFGHWITDYEAETTTTCYGCGTEYETHDEAMNCARSDLL